jgi:SAM-dependent methyltransferase
MAAGWLQRLKIALGLGDAVYSPDRLLRIPRVRMQESGACHAVTMRLISMQPLRFEVIDMQPPLDQVPPASARKTVTFRCNVCGMVNQASQKSVSKREAPSCAHCHSSLRMRSMMLALAQALFGQNLALPEFPQNPQILGLGMSDWDGYALPLAAKLGYVNTYYHQPPRLDIMQPGEDWPAGNYDFILSSDVLEHVPPPVSTAFRNAFDLLKPGGALILTVPYHKTGHTQEHFPELHDYRIEQHNGEFRLHNRTRDGREQVFDNLIFHGGPGFTLEMRMFAEADLIADLRAAGFTEIQICGESYPAFGILWPIDWALPIIARKPL